MKKIISAVLVSLLLTTANAQNAKVTHSTLRTKDVSRDNKQKQPELSAYNKQQLDAVAKNNEATASPSESRQKEVSDTYKQWVKDNPSTTESAFEHAYIASEKEKAATKLARQQQRTARTNARQQYGNYNNYPSYGNGFYGSNGNNFNNNMGINSGLNGGLNYNFNNNHLQPYLNYNIGSLLPFWMW